MGENTAASFTPHHDEIYPELNGIERRKACTATPKTNGFTRHFNRASEEEFFDIALDRNFIPARENSRRFLTNDSNTTTRSSLIMGTATWKGGRQQQSLLIIY
ncbi:MULTISPECIES: hypothetical protein [unclassified Akkermansia]|jgi:integrase, catalytic region|uniref:hypothetical protein n=1 Tax=unclassified Akkermansia TaxID=2608915 RepID=UPI0010221266|nr:MULTISPECIES: hypothetical protein [unclassified Akkermansia]KAA3164357.1 hypothetical protein F2A01_04250 [Akkermansia sp. BIOML-A60]KAA3166551.1 hypothetical protein F2A23_03920 [Akkermansia sp. BIOML-A63]KAA3175205.1 hypothetical protein F2A07_01060 [Akkermansia sp. BIOML-A61]KAA3197209.1 hypothetical protein F2A21_01055 [Akkermansia sp. BIOML-A54]KAA3225382.1 hypothetical protein F1985_02190 [Akkermansia sp. BIOML-A41]KAA3244166.1 hypothetical protein F1971_00200 [Akkermansia sp. BIOML